MKISSIKPHRKSEKIAIFQKNPADFAKNGAADSYSHPVRAVALDIPHYITVLPLEAKRQGRLISRLCNTACRLAKFAFNNGKKQPLQRKRSPLFFTAADEAIQRQELAKYKVP